MRRTRWPEPARRKTVRKRTKCYNQLIAVNLIDRMKEFEKYPPPIPGFKISRMQYLIHLILSHKQKKYPGAYSVLNMLYMTNIIPGANKYLDFLKQQDIIEWKNYSAGRNSRIYRMVDEGKTEYRTISDKTLIHRIEKNNYKIRLSNSKMFPALNKWIKYVEFDEQGALETIEQEYSKNVLVDSEKAEALRTYSLAAIVKIKAGEIYYKVNKTNYRLDSNYTALPGELIKHISINGQKPYEMDISNSQPFFLSTLFQMTPEVEQVCQRYLGNSFTMYIKNLHLIDHEDVKLYQLLVTTGKFYEYMMDKFKENNIKFTDRKDVKGQLFIVLFGKLHADKYNPAARLFKQEFPHVQKLINLIKQKQHNRLPILLQRVESYVILKRVAKRIELELPALPILTKHDSILPFKIIMYSKEISKVQEIMVNTISEVTGLIPQGRMRRYVK